MQPFYGETDAALIAANKAGTFDFHIADWCNISLAAQELVGALMDPDPAKRPTALQALQHPWLSCAAAVDMRPGRCESYATTNEDVEDEDQ
eukprot:18655-Heterococcus_DN1.PRE.1